MCITEAYKYYCEMDGKRVLWLLLVVVRIGWSLVPQYGYIHPDEFFQTVEVVAGDVFYTQVTRTWEFNSTFPLRSVVIPKLLFTPLFHLVKVLSDTDVITISGWIILSSTRFVMACLSLCIDFLVYKSLKLMKGDYSKGVLLVAGSYVTLTYQCHTFTNSFETLLFSLLMYVIFSSSIQMINFNAGKPSQKKSKQVKAKDARMTVGLPHVPYSASVSFGILTVAGIFNRPTFVIFSFLPTLWWLYVLIKYSDCTKQFITQTLLIMLSAVATCGVFCAVDTLYFSNLSVPDLLKQASLCFPLTFDSFNCLKTISSTYFVFTPWNFIQYNTKKENLAEHGTHPFYLHFCVNMPLLFGPLIVYLLKSVGTCCQYLMVSFKNDANKNHNDDSTNVVLLTLFWLFPVAIFSIFPHQEPRFLIPLLPIVTILAVVSVKSFCKFFIAGFVILNIILTILFGILHQGGLIHCILKLQSVYNTDKITKHSAVSYNFIFSHTYMPPKFPLLIQSSKVKVWDTKGGNFEEVLNVIQNIRKSMDQHGTVESKIFLITPAVGYYDIKSTILNITLVDKFYPHLSFEDPPKVVLAEKYGINSRFKQIHNQLHLLLLEIH